MRQRQIFTNTLQKFDTGGYSENENRPLAIEKNKKVRCMMKDKHGGKIMTDFVALTAKTSAYKVDR